MKRLLFALTLLCSPALAQDITNHSIPVGGGPGSVGWKTVGPCAVGQTINWPSGVSGDPACGAGAGGVTAVPDGGTGGTSWTANLPLLGNGTSALIQGTKTGTTNVFATATGALTSGNCIQVNANGNLVDAGSPCGVGVQQAHTQDFVAPGDFTPGSTTTLVLSVAPTSEDFLLVAFDGIVQSHNTYSLATATITFAAAIPASVQVVEAQWYAATTVAGVGSLNGLSGGLTIAGANCINVSAVGSTITIGCLPSGIVTPAVVADGQFLTDGSMTNGGTALTSASNPFVAGDVGKGVQCGGTAAAGALSTGTITAFNSAGSVTVSFTAGSTIVATAVCQWGTDNTTVINAALAGLTTGGTVLLPVGYIMVSSINLTNKTSINFTGAGCAIQGVQGTTLVGTTSSNNRAMLDLVGAEAVIPSCMQIHTQRSPVAPGAAILAASSSLLPSTLMEFNRLFVAGTFRVAAVVFYGTQDSTFRFSQIWNYNKTLYGQVGSGFAFRLETDNGTGIASGYATIATGTQSCGNMRFYDMEIHDFKVAAASAGAALYLRGCAGTYFYSSSFDSSTTAGIITIDEAGDGTDTQRLMLYGSTLYTENGITAANCFQINSGTLGSATFLNASFGCTTTRTGTITYTGLQTP